MKNNKPVHFILYGSLLVFVATILVLITIHFAVSNLPVWVIVFTPIVVAFFTYIVFYMYVEQFVNARLKVLYRTIQKGKTVPNSEVEFKITKSVFEDAEIATKKWAEAQNAEISNLREKENFRKEFLGNLAHELKTPLFSIQGYILTLLEGGLEDEKVNRVFLERASNSVDRMVNLIEDLDQITKLEVNALQMDFQSFDIKKLTKEIIDSLELKAKEKQIKVSFSRDYPILQVYADRVKIAQVLLNLITNSINYGNEGGETKIRFHEMNDLLLIEVSDNGPGIDKKDIPRLFERFYRVEKSRTRNEGGSGLGLAIAKHIIESHGQSINVRSTVGLGCTFSFSLSRNKPKSDSLKTSKGVVIH
jgi:two-component system phosphate regulon sensor histidine kinase PhoR